MTLKKSENIYVGLHTATGRNYSFANNLRNTPMAYNANANNAIKANYRPNCQ